MPTTETSGDTPSTSQDRVDESIQSTVDVAVGDLTTQVIRGRSGAVAGSEGGSANDPFALAEALAMAEQLAASDQQAREYAERARAGVKVAQGRFDANSALERHDKIETAKGYATKAVVGVIDTVGSPLTAGQINLASGAQAGVILHQKHHLKAKFEEIMKMENSDPKINAALAYFIKKANERMVESVAAINPIASKVHTVVGQLRKANDLAQGRPRNQTEAHCDIVHQGLIANQPQALATAAALLGDPKLVQNIKTAQSKAGLNVLKGAVRK